MNASGRVAAVKRGVRGGPGPQMHRFQDPLAGGAQALQDARDPRRQQVPIALPPFSGNHDAINIGEAGLHQDGRHWVMHRPHVQRGRVDHHQVGLLTGSK